MRKFYRELLIIGTSVWSIACGEPPIHTHWDMDAPARTDASVSKDGDASVVSNVDASTTANCRDVAISCITYTCVNSGECDPKNSNTTFTTCYACIAAAAKGALCKQFIENCAQLAVCFRQ